MNDIGHMEELGHLFASFAGVLKKLVLIYLLVALSRSKYGTNSPSTLIYLATGGAIQWKLLLSFGISITGDSSPFFCYLCGVFGG